MSTPSASSEEIEEAVRWYWSTKDDQEQDQLESERSTRGKRASVLGGGHLDGFASLVEDILVRNGISEDSILHDHDAVLPGHFRNSKRWDIAVVHNNDLLAALELKSQTSSYGNNYNNRVEEAIGSATDLQEAYQGGLLNQSFAPWVGYMMLLGNDEESRSSVEVREPNFDVDPAFEGASYADRYELLCERLVQEQLVDSAAFLLTSEDTMSYSEPNPSLRFEQLARQLTHHVLSTI